MEEREFNLRITRAKKDDYVRRFFNKNHTDHTDLIGAVSFWIAMGFPRSSLTDYLRSIVPKSDWIESKKFDASLPTRRQRYDYNSPWRSLMSRQWRLWEK